MRVHIQPLCLTQLVGRETLDGHRGSDPSVGCAEEVSEVEARRVGTGYA